MSRISLTPDNLDRLLGLHGPDSVQDVINPFRNRFYPLSNVGPSCRFSTWDWWSNTSTSMCRLGWMSREDLWRALLDAGVSLTPDAPKKPHVSASFEQSATNPVARTKEMALVDEALLRRALSSYRKEWEGVAALRGLDTIISQQPAAVVANEVTGQMTAPHLEAVLSQNGRAVLMDLGPGTLGTTASVLSLIETKLLSGLTVVLADVMDEALVQSRARLQNEFHIPADHIVCVETFLQGMEQNEALGRFTGEVDVVVSGACIHQNPDFPPIFRFVHSLLRTGGLFRYWDWLHCLWEAPVVKRGVHLRTNRDLLAAVEMAQIWVGLWGYGVTPGQRAAGERLSDLQIEVASRFWETVANGFNFLRWVETNLVGIEPLNGKSPYCCAEAHQDPRRVYDMLKMAFNIGNVKRDFFSTSDTLCGFLCTKDD